MKQLLHHNMESTITAEPKQMFVEYVQLNFFFCNCEFHWKPGLQ